MTRSPGCWGCPIPAARRWTGPQGRGTRQNTSFPEASLVPRAVMALEQTGYRKIAVAGGVAANSRIRADILAAAEKLGAEVYLPPLHLCGDNGAMIGAQAYYEYKAGHVADMSLNAYATKSILGEAL